MKVLLILLTTLQTLLGVLDTHILKSDLTVTVSEPAVQPMTYKGTMVMHGECFLIEMFGTEVAYDGKTMYVYDSSTDELTLSIPNASELLEMNPLLFAKALQDASELKEKDMQDKILMTLTPKDQSIGISRFTLKVKKKPLLPLSIELKEGNKKTTLRLVNPAYVQTAPKFKVERKGAYINDLR